MEVCFAAEDGRALQRLRFIPTRSRCQADQRDGVRMVVGGLATLLEELLDLRKRQEGEFYLIGLDLADLGERVVAYWCSRGTPSLFIR